MLAIAKITSRGQTTIPRSVREALNISSGDSLVWEIDSYGVTRVRKVEPLDLEYLSAVEQSLSEWSSAEDEGAYHDL